MSPRSVPSIGLSALLLAAAAPALADVVHITSYAPASTEGLGAFTGTLSYTPTGETTGTLTISLTNTSEHAGGRITGFLLRVPDPAAMAALSGPSQTHPLFLDTGAADVIVEGRYTLPYQEHAYLQPEAGLGYIDEQGRITINGAPLDEPYLFSLDGERDKPADQDFDVTVPQGRLWVMGDHRSASGDSLQHWQQ